MTLPEYKPHPDREARISSAMNAITAILQLSIYPAHKKELLSVCIWKLREAEGKLGVRYWSEGAVSADRRELRHAHVSEPRELIKRLLDEEPVEHVVCDAIACIVTKQEHVQLGRSTKSGWSRYIDAGIRVYDAMERSWSYPAQHPHAPEPPVHKLSVSQSLPAAT